MLYVENVKDYQEHFGMYYLIQRDESNGGVGFVTRILPLLTIADLNQPICSFSKENASQMGEKFFNILEPRPVCVPVLRL